MIITTFFVNKQGETKEVKNIVDDVDDDKLGLFIETFVGKMYSRQLSALTKIMIQKDTKHIFVFDDDDKYYYYVKERELMIRFITNAYESIDSAQSDLKEINERLSELK